MHFWRDAIHCLIQSFVFFSPPLSRRHGHLLGGGWPWFDEDAENNRLGFLGNQKSGPFALVGQPFRIWQCTPYACG